MIIYTPEQIFDLLAAVSCEKDVVMIDAYVSAYWHYYTVLDVRLFLQSIRMIKEIFNSPHI